MLKMFLTHAPHALENYYGARVLGALQKTVKVQVNETDRFIDTQGLIEQTPGNDILVVDLNTPLDADFFENCAGVVAVHRGTVDHRIVGVEAISKKEILVINASPGFVDSVTDFIIEMMTHYRSIGRRLPEVAAFLGMKVLVHDPYITITEKHIHQVSFQDVLAGADFNLLSRCR